ncbi:hypothetical protein BDZ45DRAFT_749586 [Acephala macrosclerotiorum]|nr:hypothetical protein BDZ45DRAFT_749586 [Acephala macrosclerotiorum]
MAATQDFKTQVYNWAEAIGRDIESKLASYSNFSASRFSRNVANRIHDITKQYNDMVERLTQEKAVLEKEITDLKRETAELTTKNLDLRLELLKEVNQELQTKIKLQEPLVKCGVAVCRRFLEQVKEQRGHGEAIESIIEAGNRAAHGGDFLSDLALFKLGYMKILDSTAAPEQPETGLELTNGSVFRDLYHPNDQWKECKTYPYQQEIEFYNICGTLSSSAPYNLQSMYSNPHFTRFSHCAISFNDTAHIINQAQGGGNNFNTAMDASPEIENSLREMRDVVEEIRRLYKARYRAWRISRAFSAIE